MIIPVYNRDKFIGEAIQSVLDQTYKNFELIIIDDASTDNTLNIVRQFDDSRIKIIRNKENKGVSYSRNKGISSAKGEFIAFMDSDDISEPTRLNRQLEIFYSKDNLIVCGSWLRLMNSDKLIKHKEYHDEIISRLLIHCSLSLGSVMMKSNILKKNRLNPDLNFGEDYDLWSRVCWMGRMYNIPEPLLLYRIHDNQLSGKNKQEQLKMDANIRLSLFKKLDYSSSDFSDTLIKKIFMFDSYISVSEFSNFLKWLNRLKELNKIQKIFPQEEFVVVIEQIRRNLIFKIYYRKSSIGLSKLWRIKSLRYLRKTEALQIVSKKIKLS